jgi:hypothetical protein
MPIRPLLLDPLLICTQLIVNDGIMLIDTPLHLGLPTTSQHSNGSSS